RIMTTLPSTNPPDRYPTSYKPTRKDVDTYKDPEVSLTNRTPPICVPDERDTKAGTLVGTDRFGNKFYENNEEELPLRTKWVDYKEWKEYDASHVEPGWHAWLAYMVDKPPGAEPVLKHEVKPWEKSEHLGNPTFSRGAYKPYSTTKPKLGSWEPEARPRR
ncbi:NADH ubiquinone oxidoreductase subunit NDUFA12-domain-containing protein, partial [Tuber indicum]